MTPSEFKKLFHSEQYDYLKSLGFEFATINPYGRQEVVMANNVGSSGYQKILAKYTNAHPCNEKFRFVQVASSSTSRHIISPQNVEKETLDFYTIFYHKYPEHQKNMLKDYWSFFMSSRDRLIELTYRLTENKTPQEISKFILDFPISAWGIDSVNLVTLDKFLRGKGLISIENDDFFYEFIKSRKKELKEPREGIMVRDFLFNKYGTNSPTIAKYVGVSPFIKSYFKKPKIDFVENEAKFSTVILVKIKKLKNSFLIDNWDEDKYSNALHLFCNGIKNIYNLHTCKLVDADTTPRNYAEKPSQYNILALHDETTFTKELLQKTLTDFFIHLQSNLNFELTVNNVEKWVEKYELHKELSQLPTKASSANKPSKI